MPGTVYLTTCRLLWCTLLSWCSLDHKSTLHAHVVDTFTIYKFTNGNPLPISLATLYLAHWHFTSYALHVCIAYYHTHITLHFGSTHCAILVAQDVGGEVLVKRVAMQPPARTPCMWLQRGISGGKRPRSVNVLTSNQDPAVEQTCRATVH